MTANDAETDPRTELIAIQKRISKRLKDEIRASLGEVSPAVQIYYDEYNRELRRFDKLVTKAELLERVAKADIVYQGDYHTLRQSQRTLCRILAATAKIRPHILLGLEMVHAEQQEILDDYQSGDLAEEDFLDQINYEERWGFPWANYQEILELCRARNIRVLAINSEPHRKADRIIERDFRTAEIIVEATESEPDALMYVFDGDLHVARDHLPLIVDTLLHRRGLERRRVVIYQNSEAIYWQLAARKLEHKANVVRIADDTYCIINATPIERLQSYLNWQQHQDELEPMLPGWDEEVSLDYTEQIYHLVQTICQFLEIEREDLDDLTVFTTRDLDFLKLLTRDRLFSKAEIDEIERQIMSSKSYFIPQGNIIYLADLSVNQAAEEAAHFIHAKCAGYAEEPLAPADEFYYRTMREALGFVGSKIITHTRDTWHEGDFAALLKRRAGRGDTQQRVKRAAARFVLQHRRFERKLLSGKKSRRLNAIYRQKVDVHLAITAALGYMLGERLYRGMLSGLKTIAEIRELFHQGFFHEDEGFRVYMELVERLSPLDDLDERRSDRL